MTDNNVNINFKKIDIYKNDEYLSIMNDADMFEKSSNSSHYKSLFCLKECTKGCCDIKSIKTAFDNISKYIVNTYDEILYHNNNKLCVLPKNHSGNCQYEINQIFTKNKTTDKLNLSISQCIYYTPGNDGYVFKNRASRTFPIMLSRNNEKLIKDKNTKLKCAIPIAEFSTPFMLATAYIDWMCYILHVSDISQFLHKKMLESHSVFYNIMKTEHKTFLENYFSVFKRRVFDDNNTICAITQNIIIMKNLADISRDNRIIIDNCDIQMGHIVSRNENTITIRGLNLVMMSRSGNRIIGEYSFIDDEWILMLKNIIEKFHL